MPCYAGSAELAAVGVSASVFNLVSKLFNVPLLNITTSFVAEEQALVTKDAEECDQTAQGTFLLASSNSIFWSVSYHLMWLFLGFLTRSPGRSSKQQTFSFSINFSGTCCWSWHH